MNTNEVCVAKEFKKEIESLHEDLDVKLVTEGTYSIALCKVK